MNLKLFKANLKSNWLLLLIFYIVMLMYFSIITSMYDPKDVQKMAAMLASLPPQLMKAVGFSTLSTNLTSFLGEMYYGFIAIMFPMIYCIILGNKLIARHVENGSMSYLLSTPNSRIKIAITQAAYIIASITILIILITISGIVVSASMFSGLLNIGSFILINVCLWFLFCAISSICFFFSCVFNESKNSLALGAGIPVLFFVIKVLANASDKYKWIKDLTILSLFNPTKIIAGDTSVIISCAVLLLISIVLYLSAIIIFDRKDLPL